MPATERRPRPCWRERKQVVEAGSGEQQQAMSRPRARHCQATEGRVELVEGIRTGQRVDGHGDSVGLPLPRVDGRRDEHPVG